MRANNREKELDKQPTKLVDTISGAANPISSHSNGSIVNNSYFLATFLQFLPWPWWFCKVVAMALVGWVWRPWENCWVPNVCNASCFIRKTFNYPNFFAHSILCVMFSSFPAKETLRREGFILGFTLGWRVPFHTTNTHLSLTLPKYTFVNLCCNKNIWPLQK